MSWQQRNKRFWGMRLAKRGVLTVMAVLLLLASGCTGKSADGGHAGQTGGADGAGGGLQDDAGTASGDQTKGGRDGLPETPPEDDSDLPLDEQLASLAETGAPVADLLNFVRMFAGQASPAEMSAMLQILEEKQLEQIFALEDRFYEEAGIQEELLNWYVKLERLPKAADLPDGPAKRLLEDTEAGGYKAETAEGMFFPVIDYAVYKEFRSRATEDMQAYIDLMAKESDEPAVKDAALVIPWEEVARRALACESFVAAYPDSPRAAMADRIRKDYTYITFRGIDNSPLFEREGGPAVEAALSAFKKVLETADGTADSRYLSDLREFVRLIEAGGGRQTDAVRAFQEKVTEGLLDDYDEQYENLGRHMDRKGLRGRPFLFSRPLL